MTDSIQIVDQRGVPVFIHSELDDLGLTPEAFRVYCHLVRRAGNGTAFPKQQSIGDICFPRLQRRGADHKRLDKPVGEVNRRVMAMNAIAALVEHGLITQSYRYREDGKRTSSVYNLRPPSEWKSWEQLLRSQGDHGQRSQGDHSPGSQGALSPGSQGDQPKGIPKKEITPKNEERAPDFFSENEPEQKPSPVKETPIAETNHSTTAKPDRKPPSSAAPSLLPAKPDRPWRTGSGSNAWDEGFIAHILKYLQGLPEGQSKGRMDALTWISNREHSATPQHEILRGRWDEYRRKGNPESQASDRECQHQHRLAAARANGMALAEFHADRKAEGMGYVHAQNAWDALPTEQKTELIRKHYIAPKKS